jgi:hypothetical protein
VIGKALDPHSFRGMPTTIGSETPAVDNVVQLTGLTSPWNTFAIWDLSKLAKVACGIHGALWLTDLTRRLGFWLFRIQMSSQANQQSKKCPLSHCISTYFPTTLKQFL